MVLILVLVQAVCNAAAQFFATFVRYFAEEVQGKDKEVMRRRISYIVSIFRLPEVGGRIVSSV